MKPSIETLEDPLHLTVCDRQQLEFIGSIQGGDAGAVLVVDMHKTPALIVAYSENAADQAWCKTDRILIGQALQETVWDEEFCQSVLHNLVKEMHEGRFLRTFTTIKVPNPGASTDTDSIASLSVSQSQQNQSLTYIVSVSHCGSGVAGAVAASINHHNFGLILLEFEQDEDINTRRNELAIHLTEIGRILEDNVQVNATAYLTDDSQTDVESTLASGVAAVSVREGSTHSHATTQSATPSTAAMPPVVDEDEMLHSHQETEKLAGITAQRACDAVMRMSQQYDRGMVYRFADDLSGEVIHEVKKDFIATSYMGMRFPSSDIPLSARKLYIINGLRYIQNVDDPAIPIISSQGMQVDLSHCRMRACAAPHIAYLRNMGVKNSMSVALVVAGELWGLLAFHGYTRPFKPSLHQRIAFETVSRMVSIRIESLLKREKSSRLVDLSKLLACLKPQHPVEFLCRYEHECRTILRADAIAFKNGPNARFFADPSSQGLKPSDQFWLVMEKYPYGADMLVVSTRAQMERVGVHTHCGASGMIYFQYGSLQFVALRSVRTKDVNWAGSPDEPKLQIGDILHPRKSFESYMEKARQESRNWSEQDTEIASSFKDRLVEKLRAETLSILNSSLEASNERCADAIRLAEQNYSFFAQMSHELRTPFHGVMACLDILRKTGDDPIEREEAISVAIRSGTAMMNILNDILTMAKNKHGLELQSIEFLPSESISRIAEVMKAFAESEKIILTVHTTERVLNQWCTADKTKFEQITTNLINNAIKFTPPGGKVTASFQILPAFQETEEWWQTKRAGYAAERQVVSSPVEQSNNNNNNNTNGGAVGGNASPSSASSPASSLGSSSLSTSVHNNTGGGAAKMEWLCCAVEDTGCGIAEHDMDSVFRPYVQVSSGITRSHQGTGLGLHICTEHVRNMSGVFRCASAVNEGTMFYFAVPIQTSPEALTQTTTAAAKKKNDAASQSDSSTESSIKLDDVEGDILVVDDNKVNLKLACRKVNLIACKATIHTAVNGRLAVEKFRELYELGRAPCIILMDYHMPEMSGLEAIERIRALEKEKAAQLKLQGKEPQPQAFISCFTADLSESSTKKLMAAGADTILAKPTPSGELERIVRDNLPPKARH